MIGDPTPMNSRDRDGRVLVVGDVVERINDITGRGDGVRRTITRITASGYLLLDGAKAPAWISPGLTRRMGQRL